MKSIIGTIFYQINSPTFIFYVLNVRGNFVEFKSIKTGNIEYRKKKDFKLWESQNDYVFSYCS